MVKTKGELEVEIKLLNKSRKHIKNTLFNFRQKCYDKMVVVDSELFLSNEDFNALFEKLINKFRKNEKEVKIKMEETTKQKMNNLVIVKDLEELVKLKKKIRNDLIKEGFDPDDSADYVDDSW